MFISTFFLVLMVCVATARYADQHKGCPRNMEYKECGTRCPETCADKEPRPCVKICQPGCFCKEGYILDRDGGECIREEDCPPDQCKRNEEYRECGNPCQEMCNNGEPKMCTANCVPGCYCKQGYVRFTNRGECVPEARCK